MQKTQRGWALGSTARRWQAGAVSDGGGEGIRRDQVAVANVDNFEELSSHVTGRERPENEELQGERDCQDCVVTATRVVLYAWIFNLMHHSQ